MPECVFAERRLNSTSRSTEPSRSSGSKPSNGSTAHGRDGEHLPREPHEEGAVARLGERVRDREVGDGGREEHRAVGLLRPEVAEDVGGLFASGRSATSRVDALARRGRRARRRRARPGRRRRSGPGRGSRRRSSRTRRRSAPRRRPTAISGSLTPFCSETTKPSGVEPRRDRVAAPPPCAAT